MATTFLEPGGDATFNLNPAPDGFWDQVNDTPTIVSDFVHGTHPRSIKFRANAQPNLLKSNAFSDAGGRVSLYIYIVAYPTATKNYLEILNATQSAVVSIAVTPTGVLRLIGSGQIGSDGATLSTGKWYRISLAYTITSTSVNRFELFLDGESTISVTNGSLARTGANALGLGNLDSVDLTNDFRSSDHYVDDSSSLSDTGDIWVTAKRPISNGTTNNFNTQIGSGGSGYGTGHSPQVNERPISQTNGWSVVASGVSTEEYNIEAKNQGDIFTGNRIVDYMGWVYAKALISETGQIRLNNSSTSIALTSTPTILTVFANSTSYPAGTGVDIGISTDATVTTVSLYECGVVVAFIPPPNPGSFLQMFK